MMQLKQAVTNLVRRPIEGYVTTASGRRIPQPPWIMPDEPETAIAYDQWLLEQGRSEAAELGDDLMRCRLAGLEAQHVDIALRHLLSDFLFGRHDPEFEARGIPIG
jgi:hypothetical protein